MSLDSRKSTQMRYSTDICVVSLIGCLPVFDFRVQVTTNQRHQQDLCKATSMELFGSSLCGLSSGKGIEGGKNAVDLNFSTFFLS